MSYCCVGTVLVAVGVLLAVALPATVVTVTMED